MAQRGPTGAAVLQPHVTTAISNAVIQEWAEKGYARMSMEGVARRAGVGKTAIYRRWPSKQDMILTVLVGRRRAAVATPDTGVLREDLLILMKSVLDWLSDAHTMSIMADLVAEAVRDPGLAEAVDAVFRSPQRTESRRILERALARGELSADADLDVAVDLLPASIFWRYVVCRRPVTEAYLESVVTTILRGFLLVE